MFLLQTFGGLTLLHATTRATVGTPRRKPLAVLALVAASAERGVERDWVASMLWPELDEARARRALSQTLYALRRELGADVLRDAQRLIIEPSELVTDATDFEALARPGSSRRDLERAVSLYAGPYLDGVYFPACAEFEHWAETARAAHARAYLGALRELARLAAAAGDSAKAVLWLERAANDNPLDSDIAAALARLYADLGRHGQGHALLNAHFAALRAELGVAPPARLMSLGQELQEAPSEVDARIRASTAREPNAQRVSGSPDHSEPPGTREPSLRSRMVRALTPSGVRIRRPAVIASIAGLAAVAVAAVNLIRLGVSTSDTLPTAFTKELSPPSGVGASGRVLVHVVSMPSQDPLASYVSDVLMARLAEHAAIVPREEILALERRLFGDSSRLRDQPGSTERLLALSGASIALQAGIMNAGRRDSLVMGLTLSRRAMVPPCPEAWVRIGSTEGDPGGEYQGFESWSSFRLSAPRSSPTKSVDSLVRAATRVLESMNSCDIEAHRGPSTSPWCWVGSHRVAVVPGAIRARISSGQDITMMMTAQLPGNRSRACIYSSYGRISNSGDAFTPGRATGAH